MRLGTDYRIRERLAEALVGPLTQKPDPWPMVATFFGGIAVGALVGGWLAQSSAQRQVIALTGRARELGAKARNHLERDVILEEASEPQPAAPIANKRRTRPAVSRES
jgi:hypothetical protein